MSSYIYHGFWNERIEKMQKNVQRQFPRLDKDMDSQI